MTLRVWAIYSSNKAEGGGNAVREGDGAEVFELLITSEGSIDPEMGIGKRFIWRRNGSDSAPGRSLKSCGIRRERCPGRIRYRQGCGGRSGRRYSLGWTRDAVRRHVRGAGNRFRRLNGGCKGKKGIEDSCYLRGS